MRAIQALLLLLAAACAGPTATRQVVYADYGPSVSEAEWQSEVCQRTATSFAQGDSLRMQLLRRFAGSCEPRGLDGRAEQFDALRGSTDRELLERLVRPTYEWVDGAIFRVAESIAADRAASTEARVTALRVLHWTLSPGSYLGEEQILEEPPVAIECFGENRHLHLRLHLGAPLPEDFAERIDAVVTRLRTERETPAPLRPASNCLRMNLHRWQRMGSPAP